MISFTLDDDLQMIKDTIADFAAEQLRPHMREFEDAGKVSDEVRAAFHEMGMTSLAVPEAAGGQGLGLRAHVIVAEELAFGDVGAAADLDRSAAGVHLIATLGSDAQQQELLGPLGDPGKPDYTVSVACHEPVAGPHLDELETTATGGDGEHVTLSGTKLLVPCANDADVIVVLARVAGSEGAEGIRAYAVKQGAGGMTVGETDFKVGLNTLATNPVTFENTPAELLAGSTDLAALRTALRKVQVVGMAQSVGMCRAAMEHALQYSKDRETFGTPISQHQAIAFKLADMGILVDAARWSVWRAAAALEDGGDGATEVPSAVLQCADAGQFVTSEAVQILGGHGWVKDHPVEKWMRDARAQENLYGMSAFQADALAAALLA